MKSKKVFIGILIGATVIFAVIVLFLGRNISNILSDYGQKELEYVKGIETELTQAMSNQEELNDSLEILTDTYSMEVVVELEGEIVYSSLSLSGDQNYQNMISEKALAVESGGIVEADGQEFYVWYCIYHMSTVEYVEAYLSHQNLLILVAFIVLFLLIMLLQYFLLGPLYRVRDSIDKLERYDFDDVDAGEDELGRKVNAFSTKLNRTIKAVSRNNTNLELSLQLERERLNNTIQFSKALVHDLKSPVHNMMLENELMVEKLDDSNNEAKDIGDYNIARTDVLLRDINSVLKVLNTDIYKINLDTEDFDLVTLAQEAAKLFRTAMLKKEMSFYLEAEESIMVHLNKITIQLLFHNLISNMVQYGLENSELEIGIEAVVETVHIITRNESSAVNIKRMESSQQLFNIVVEETTKEHVYSSGNGLFLIRDLVLLLGGEYQYSADGPQVILELSIPLRGGESR